MQAALLTDRSRVAGSGEPARHFLNNLVTSDIETLAPGGARYAALLTPQGKIIADFFVVAAPEDERRLLSSIARRNSAPSSLQKLTFYRLRAKIAIETHRSCRARGLGRRRRDR